GGGAGRRDPQLQPAGQPGLLIAEKYRVLKDIGSGGFGNVYLVKHESLGKRYAVKVLRGQLAERTNFRDRFHEEALKLSRLEDENIVKVIDFGEWNEFQYMVTEYVEGQDLSGLIYGGRISPLRAARIMHQVAGAMAEAHSKQIVHLDLKPANILISAKRGRDVVKVIDFGLAEIYSDVKAGRQRKVAGTCTYMAPEQWRKRPLDPRTDIYSFGVIFYELLAGRPPFRSANVSELERSHCQTPPALLRKLKSDVPGDLERLVHRCLEKEPGKRYPSASRLEEALEGYVRRSENLVARWLKRGAVAAAALLALSTGAWALVEFLRDREAPVWKEWKVTGSKLREVPRPSVPDKHYLTLDSEVLLHLEAQDRRSATVFKVTSAGFEEREPYRQEEFPIRLKLPLGPTLLTAQATDASGNQSTVQLRIVHHRPVEVRARLDRLPRCTVEHRATLEFEALSDGKARIVCSNGGRALHDAEVSAGDDPRPKAEIPLLPGANEIRVWRINVLGEEEELPETASVTVITGPMSAHVKVAVKEPEKLLETGVPGEWLTTSNQVSLVVQVD
ncbi:MAG: serine/threonine-protein kinase, partial [Thermoanaerobaculia bacterium]